MFDKNQKPLSDHFLLAYYSKRPKLEDMPTLDKELDCLNTLLITASFYGQDELWNTLRQSIKHAREARWPALSEKDKEQLLLYGFSLIAKTMIEHSKQFGPAIVTYLGSAIKEDCASLPTVATHLQALWDFDYEISGRAAKAPRAFRLEDNLKYLNPLFDKSQAYLSKRAKPHKALAAVLIAGFVLSLAVAIVVGIMTFGAGSPAALWLGSVGFASLALTTTAGLSAMDAGMVLFGISEFSAFCLGGGAYAWFKPQSKLKPVLASGTLCIQQIEDATKASSDVRP